MEKTKKIIISLAISFVIVLLIYLISNFKSNSEFINLPVFKSNLLENTILNKNDIEYISVKKSSLKKDFEEQIINPEIITNGLINRNVYKGEFVLKSVVKNENESKVNGFEYVSLPISSDSLAICNNLKFGDKVDVYYTAKLRDVSFAIKDKERIYSNNLKEGYVTCVLFEDVDVVAKTDSTGREDNNNLISNITVRLSKKDAMLVSNLKAIGTIDILSK